MSELFYSEDEGIRYLHFGSRWVQGAMRMSAPNRLELSYTRDMMAWLLFLESPVQITQLGLGAGSLTKYCLAHCKSSRITVVEISDMVIHAAQMWFKFRADHPRLAVVHADAQVFLTQAAAKLKSDSKQLSESAVLQVDLYDHDARGPVLDSAAFYASCRDYLRGQAQAGIAVFNFFGSAHLEKSLLKVSNAFAGRVIRLPACLEGNVVVIAFTGNDALLTNLGISLSALRSRAQAIQTKFGIPTEHWLKAWSGARLDGNCWLLK